LISRFLGEFSPAMSGRAVFLMGKKMTAVKNPVHPMGEGIFFAFCCG